VAGVFVGVCEWPRRARVEKGGMELRVQQQHGGWDVEPSYASYEASWPGTRGRRGASIVPVDPGARASTGGRPIVNFDARVSCCVAVDGRRERVWSALCCWTGLDMVDPWCSTASRPPVIPTAKK
jgi:hypothetical protein